MDSVSLEEGKTGQTEALVVSRQNPFKCAICEEKFIEKDAALQHILIHSKLKTRNFCIKCGEGFQDTDAYEKHMKEHDSDYSKTFECEVCNQVFYKLMAYQTHILSHREYVFTCPTCSQTFTVKHEFRSHLESHPDMERYECFSCHRTYLTMNSLKRHLRSHEGKKFLCILCDKKFALKTQYREHMKSHIEDKKFKCDNCKQLFRKKQSLQRHSCDSYRPRNGGVNNHIADAVDLQCSSCNRSFTSHVDLIRHMNETNESSRVPCTTCGKTQKSCYALKRHITLHVRDFKCNICDSTFSRKFSYDLHMKKMHEKDEPQECKVCGVTLYKHSYRTHMMRHEGKKVYKCEMCPKEYPHASSYIRHVASHKDERNYECEICGKKSLQKTHHLEHMRTHNEKRMFECSICKRGFNANYYYRKHMRQIHSSETPFLCEACGEAFTSEIEQIAHSELAHGIEFQRDEDEGAGDGAGADFSTTFPPSLSKPDELVGVATKRDRPAEKKQFDNLDFADDFITDGFGFNEGDGSADDDDRSFQGEDDCARSDASNHSDFDIALHTPAFVACDAEEPSSPAAITKEEIYIKQEVDGGKVQLTAVKVHRPIKLEHEQTKVEHGSIESEDGARDLMTRNASENVSSNPGDNNNETGKPIESRSDNEYKNHFERDDGDSLSETQNGKTKVCNICDQILPKSHAERANHILTHHEFYCTVCCKRYIDFNQYNEHLATHRIDRIELVCTKCGEIFFDKDLFNGHTDRHDNEIPVPCEFCARPIFSYNHERHMKQHAGDSAMECRHCGRKCKTRETYVRHMKKHGGIDSQFKCDSCSQTFRKKTHYTRHMNMHSADKKYTCEKCNIKFYALKWYKKHVLKIHNVTDPFKCAKCAVSFDDDVILAQHGSKCTAEAPIVDTKKFNCAHCEQCFTEEAQIVEHLEEHRFKPTTCEVCCRIFDDIKKYKKHIRIHAKDKPFHCPICQRGFFEKRLCRRHELQHDRKRWNKCTKCDSRFLHKIDLKNHMLKHDGISAYRCEICSKEFNHRSSWRRHNLSHSGVKNFKCKECGKEFRQSGHLAQHLVTHMDVGKFNCTICKINFRLQSNMKRHMRTKHSSMTPFLCEICGQSFADEDKRNEHAEAHNAG